VVRHDLQISPARSGEAGVLPDFADDAAELLNIATTSEHRSLRQLVEIAVRQVTGCSGAMAVLWDDGEPELSATSHPELSGLTEVQQESGRGPDLDALTGAGPVSCPDTLDEPRWPEYSHAALRRGVRCSVTLAQRRDPKAISLALLGARPRAIDPGQVPFAELLISFGSAAMSNASEFGDAQRAALQLRDAAEARAVVDQAKGILMQALGCGADEALDRMRRISQTQSMRVTDVALKLIGARGGGRGASG
jgi:ANTAR domain